MPKAMAATRKLLGMSSAGSDTIHSLVHVLHGRAMQRAQERGDHQQPEGVDVPCARGGSFSRKSVSRRCSLRWMAMAAPIMASHRKQIDTTSSIQTTGMENR